MAHYRADTHWQRRDGEAFTDQRYSRAHEVRFDGGVVLPASASPHVVPLPWADPDAVDPEEMFVASLSSCHMLWFLALAAKEGWVVDRYHDAADGEMAKNAAGQMVMTRVTLRPQVDFGGERRPDAAALAALHHHAHEQCFIANSVKSEVRIEPR